MTVAISEANALSVAEAGSIITGSEIVEVNLIDATTGATIGSDAISKIYITITFDPAKVPVGSLESGAMVIYQAADLAALIAGNATPIPVSQILLPVDYANGKATFWVTGLSAFGVGAAPGGATTTLTDSDSDDCFIATAAFGSPFEKHVKILRKFRDVFLLPTGLGEKFVQAYYRLSPPVADFIAGHDGLRTAVRVALLPAVGISYAMLHLGAVWTLMAVAGFMIAALVMVRRRIGRD